MPPSPDVEDEEPAGGLRGEISALFGTVELYAVLKVEATATETELKKAYRKLALKVHPDRAKGDKETATKRFQALSKVYKILGDKGSRQLYDETGEMPEDGAHFDKDPNKTWTDYFNELFPKVTAERLQDDKVKYQHSDEERADIRAAYLSSEGDMQAILDTVVHCTADDEPRFTEMITAMIKAKEVKAYPKFTRETKAAKKARKRNSTKEAGEADRALHDIIQKRGGGKKPSSEADLFAMIRSKPNAGMSTLDALAAKYAPKAGAKKGSSKSKKRKDAGEPSEEEFLAAQARVQGKKKDKT